MNFTCARLGCDNEAKIGDKCIKHACEALKRERLGSPLPSPQPSPVEEEGVDASEISPLLKGGERGIIKEDTMSEKKCAECGQPQKEGERFYRDMCPECRGKGKAAKKPAAPRRKKTEPLEIKEEVTPGTGKTPSPSMGEGRGEGETLTDTPPPPRWHARHRRHNREALRGVL